MEISIEHLNKNYGKQNVLKDISLHIPIGMYGMLGENGAGKSTTIKAILNLIHRGYIVRADNGNGRNQWD